MTCLKCDGPLTFHEGRGRQPKYCSRACKDAVVNRCRVMRCNRYANFPDGLCSTHYRKELRSQKAWTMADEILDFLDLEGWATPAEIADRFGRHLDSVERTLRKLRDEGRVVSKHIELAYAANSGAYEARTEWRVA